MFDRGEWKERIAWFEQARFGLFVHYGLYSIPARGEWVRSTERMPKGQYDPYFMEFDARDFRPEEWARLARRAGMKYAVLTAKHHDGFCLFHSALTDYQSANTPAGRDLVDEFLTAFRREGLRVGLYYSLLDWAHPDYPHYGDLHHPMRGNPEEGNEKRDFGRYLNYLHGQVKELCSNYGKLDLLWFDFAYDNLRGEAWRGRELVRMVRALQPDIVLNNRLEASGEGFGSLLGENPSDCCGDFVSPEQIIPPEGIRDGAGNPVPWEACVTMNNHWGFCAGDDRYKPPAMLIRKLVECVSKGGNLILNVGPDGRGSFPPRAVETLTEIGSWMEKNGESVFCCGPADIPKPDYGRVTAKENKLYYHVIDNPIGFLPLPGIKKEEIARIRLVETGTELPLAQNWITGNYPDTAFTSLGDNPVMPDIADTVVLVERKEKNHEPDGV